MPKAAIDEYGHPGTREDKIGGETLILQWPASYSVAESQSVHGSAHGNLWPSISLAVSPHNVADALR
jgi:hypothetical protein